MGARGPSSLGAPSSQIHALRTLQKLGKWPVHSSAYIFVSELESLTTAGAPARKRTEQTGEERFCHLPPKLTTLTVKLLHFQKHAVRCSEQNDKMTPSPDNLPGCAEFSANLLTSGAT
jgi:hypothetical protein